MAGLRLDDPISNAAGTGPATFTGQWASKAWVNFNGTGTIAIRSSENVSSLTDNGTGRYSTNLTSALSSTDDAAAGGHAGEETGGIQVASPRLGFVSTSEYDQFTAVASSGSALDTSFVYVTIHGDLA